MTFPIPVLSVVRFSLPASLLFGHSYFRRSGYVFVLLYTPRPLIPASYFSAARLMCRFYADTFF